MSRKNYVLLTDLVREACNKKHSPLFLKRSIGEFIGNMLYRGYTDNEIHVAWLKYQTQRINREMAEQCRIIYGNKKIGDWCVDKRLVKKERRSGYERVKNENPLAKLSPLRSMKRKKS